MPMMREHRLPGQQHQQQRGGRRHRHLADVAGEIVGAERFHRSRTGEGAGDQRRSERMLRAGAEPADQKRDHQGPEAHAGAGDQIADARQRCAQRQHQRQAKPLREQRGWNLESRHGAGVAGAQQTERRIADAELGLPERQHDVDQIGVAVVQRMCAARHAERAALVGLADGRVGRRGRMRRRLRRAHAAPCGARRRPR